VKKKREGESKKTREGRRCERSEAGQLEKGQNRSKKNTAATTKKIRRDVLRERGEELEKEGDTMRAESPKELYRVGR